MAFSSLTRTTLQHGLPRIIAPVSAGFGFFSGSMIAGTVALVPCLGMMYSPAVNKQDIIKLFTTILVAGGTCGAVSGYTLGHLGGSLLANTLPFIKNSKTLMIKPGISAQFAIGILSALFCGAIASNYSQKDIALDTRKPDGP